MGGNAYTPATPEQIRYVVQWFREWSEMQRSDFLPVLIQKFYKKGAMNGLISEMDSCNLKTRPPTIFQCRIKLFNEWTDSWNENDKEQFLAELQSIDQEFTNKLENQKNGEVNPKEVLTNGNDESMADEC